MMINNRSIEGTVWVRAAIGVILCTAVTVQGQAIDPRTSLVEGDVAVRIDSYLAAAQRFGYSGAVLVELAGDVVLRKSYGRVRKGGDRLSPATPFPVASLTKQFTAAAILRLEMSGQLSTQDRLADHVSEFLGTDKAEITLHQLLTHTSGLAGDFAPGSAAVSKTQALARIQELPLEFEPGASYMYSNTGYNLLALIVERVSGTPWAEYLEKTFFAPLGMNATRAWRYGDPELKALGFNAPERAGRRSWDEVGAGDVLSTVHDLSLWLAALDEGQVLSKDALEKLYSPELNNYAYGWKVAESQIFGHVIWHDGDIGTISTSIRRYLDRDVTVVYLDNSQHRVAVLNKILRIALGVDTEIPPTVLEEMPADANAYGGVYEVGPNAGVKVEPTEGGLKISAFGQEGVFALVPHDAEQRKLALALYTRTSGIVRSVSEGDFAPLTSAFNPRMPASVVEEAVSEEWDQFVEKHGPFRNLKLLGVSPSVRGTSYAFALLEFTRGKEMYRFEWNGNQIDGITETARLPGGLESRPASALYRPVNKEHFIFYDLASETRRTVEFRLAEDGSADGIWVDGPAGRRLAPRSR